MGLPVFDRKVAPSGLASWLLIAVFGFTGFGMAASAQAADKAAAKNPCFAAPNLMQLPTQCSVEEKALHRKRQHVWFVLTQLQTVNALSLGCGFGRDPAFGRSVLDSVEASIDRLDAPNVQFALFDEYRRVRGDFERNC
jgi:hypothetical protein